MIYYLKENDLNGSSAVLRVYGPDANTYLQGQFTQELRIKNGESAYGLWLDQKGKVLADSHVLRRADHDYLVVSFSASAAVLRARLEAYLIADEVELVDETANWGGLLLWGDGAASLPAPGEALDLPSRRADAPARQWLVPAARVDEVAAGLASRATSARPEDATLTRLRAGIPAVPVDIGGRDLPNEGGLDETAISYTKGCYLGQEVMARLKNLGQVRRRLHLVRGAGAAPAAGTPLFQLGRKVGETRSAATEGGGFLAMAMVSLVNLDRAAAVNLGGESGPLVEILRHV